jgi:hypothetical protein
MDARTMHGVRLPARQVIVDVAGHRPSALVAYTAAGASVVVATFLPWLRSGSTSRSSYDLLGLLSRLDIAPDGPVSTLVRLWPIVPLVVTGAVVLAWWQRWVASLVAALVAIVYAGGVGGTLVLASRRTPISIGPGPWVCAVASAVFLVSAGWMVFTHARGPGVPVPREAPPADRS